MTELPIVHVVCEADYESNGPVALFTRPEDAEKHAADLRGQHRNPYEVRTMRLLDCAPERAETHIHRGFVRHDDGQVEGEKTWTVENWNYDVPVEPVVSTALAGRITTQVHVAAESAEAAGAAFWEAVEQVRATL